MSRRPITLVLPYYDNPGMLEAQFQALDALPPELREQISLIVVDDCSPKSPALDVGRPQGVAYSLFRITVDVRWNWIAARNRGAEEAPDGWLLLTDIDHLVPEETWRRIIERKLSDRDIYRFSRREVDGSEYKPHPNSWLMTRKMFLRRVGGYDERFSGFYGTDGMFRDRCVSAARQVVVLPEALTRVGRETIPDASTPESTWGRKTPVDHENVGRIRAEIQASGDLAPKRLTFPFERLI
jgi:hypothetical protein